MRWMYQELLAKFSADCCAKLWRGEELSNDEFDAFAALLEAREINGHRWLGEMAGEDESFDTVSGRCGLPVSRVPSWQRTKPENSRA